MRVDAAAPVVLGVLAVALVTGCAPTAPAGPAPTAAAAPSAPPPDPVSACANQLTYWAGERLRGAPDAGYDYQEMGLTSAQSDALGALVDEARAQPALPPDWVPNRARALCAQIAAQPRPTGGGWP
jgi:hypothetical protein